MNIPEVKKPVEVAKKRNLQAGKSVFQKELSQIRDTCQLLNQLSTALQAETAYRRNQDFVELQELTEKSKKDDEFLILGTEAAMSIVNLQYRKQTLRKSLFSRMMDEKELNNLMQNHKENFTQFIWKRRIQTKKDLRVLFQSGSGIIGRFGDLIAESNLESIQTFERTNCSRVCQDAIGGVLCESEDIPSFFKKYVQLTSSRINPAISLSNTRLEFKLVPKLAANAWHCTFASSGPWAVKLYSKSLIRSVCDQTLTSLKQNDLPNKDTEYSYIHILSRLFDLVHPTHQLQAAILAYPLYGVQILKRRIQSLSYEISGSDDSAIDHKMATNLVKQLQKKMEKEMRAYFEFIVPFKANWRVGLASSSKVPQYKNTGYPGKDTHSFGFGQNGCIYMNDTEYRYVENLTDTHTDNQLKVIGVLTDLYLGTVHLVVEGIVCPPAFGKGAMAFTLEEQERQRILITKQQIIPMFALFEGRVGMPHETAIMKVNFGSTPFHYSSVNSMSLLQIHQHVPTKLSDVASILENNSSNAGKDKIGQEEDEKINNSLEKNYFRTSLLPDLAKSFSQFPPSVYRRSLAASRIQRAWRRWQGRLMRARIRKEQYNAACTIQRMARKKLRKIRELKNLAAAKIQKAWRRKRLIWVALLRCIYRQTIKALHAAATVIQKKWRHWHLFKNSPLASKYQTKVEDLEKAANIIIRWWRPFYARLVEIRKGRWENQNAIMIQKTWKGYQLRKMLRNDIREKLLKIGVNLLKTKHQLMQVSAAYIIQRTWRNAIQRRIRARKVKTKNLAAIKIQAAWKGFWVRSHTSLRFSYGEAVFLMAVRKNLYSCHFILKSYRPCGIVCPRAEISRD